MREKRPIFVRRKGSALIPASSIDSDLILAVPEGAEVEIIVKKRRSLPQQRMYWAMLKRVVDATDAYPTPEHLHDALRLDLNYARPIRQLDGKIRMIPDSTALDAMEGVEFQQYMDKAIARIAEAFGIDPLALEAA